MSSPYQPPTASNETDIESAIAGDVRGMQIVTFALTQGAVVIWAIMLFLNEFDVSGQADVVGWIGIGIGTVMFLASLIVPPIMLKKNLTEAKAADFQSVPFAERVGRVMGAIRGSHLIACALLEGAAFMNATIYIVGNHWIGNVIAGAVFIGLLVLKFPTTTSIAFKIQNEMT